jgi:predicted RNA-binding protein YlqC (UPF0109 family)
MSTVVKDIDFITYVVKSIVDNPDAVQVDRTVDERGVLLTLKVDPKDMGYVIGREGQNARALRILLRIVGARNNSRVNLKIYEPEGSMRRERGDRGDRDSRGSDSYRDQDIDTSAVDLKL